MLFNSIDFAIFFPIVFILYWFFAKKSLRTQNLLLFTFSYFFYACWDWRFLFLLMFSTLICYYTGLKIYKSKNNKTRAFWFWLSVSTNIGFLALFKYFNFFISSFNDTFSLLGFQLNISSLNLILPVGISFYTFHGLSYIIDIYKNKISAEKDFIVYSIFVCFFPLLVAGPIERATHLLPQFKVKRTFNYSLAVDGLKQILWGLFKKVVIADQCANYANQIFDHSSQFSGGALILGAVLFTFQIYGDFSGYSDIALGTAKLLGIELLRNFSYPYFSRDIAEFWRRWHISLSSWFKDYIYIPLGGSKNGLYKKIRNTFIIFLVSGFWHGANWTFIFWGLLNALFIMPQTIFDKNRSHLDIVAKGKLLPSVKELFQMGTTFLLTVSAWIFFRANSLTHAFSYIKGIFAGNLFSISGIEFPVLLLVLIVVFMVIEWMGREQQCALDRFGVMWKRTYRYTAYYLILFSIFWFSGKEQQFIYFQF